ncbi:hypothetical protein [Luteolibacter sp. AS25]|uniref:hypothetical protein n=1 Tax=Luteolibacter sp. AS25 TaxID=3135776 RepID=UPI00398AE90B
MRRQMVRLILAMVLVAVTLGAAMVLSADYSRSPDPKTGFKIVSAKVRQDESFFWVELYTEKVGELEHDLRKPVRLVTADGKEHRAADTTFAGTPADGFTEIWYKFWLEKEDLEQALSLKINDGVLVVKAGSGLPDLDKHGEAVFKSENWSKSWLGF